MQNKEFIDAVGIKKKEMENKIKEAVEHFQNETNFSVKSITVETVDMSGKAIIGSFAILGLSSAPLAPPKLWDRVGK